MSEKKYFVGQEVMISDMNSPARKGVVEKVGRTLVHVSGRRAGETEAFRLESGRRNDNYGHSSIHTMEAWEERQERSALFTRLRATGITVAHEIPTGYLRQLVRLGEEITKNIEEAR